jgi:hypothetical protein
MKLLQPTDADAARLARHVETYPDAVRVLFHRPVVTANEAGGEEAARFANLLFEEEQRRRVRRYVRARREHCAAAW